MKMRFLSVFAGLTLLAACETAPVQDNGNADANGQNTVVVKPMNGQNAVQVDTTTREYFAETIGDTVLFDFDSYQIRQDASAVLVDQASWLKANNQYSLLLAGFADERGTREYNIALGERRANAVKDFLVLQGVDMNRIRVISYGKERPVCFESTEACWAKNRRAVTILQ
jgi:peptidoglycan-associated lipoprotein